MNKKKLIILISTIIILAILVCVGIFALGGNKGSKIADKLDMGEKYLEELEYEKALAVYREILEIDPKNVEAYLGIVDTYMAMGDYTMALEYAEKGYEETGDEVFLDKIEESKEAGGQETQDSVSGETGNTEEEPPIATPESDVLLEGTKELEIVVPEDVEVAYSNAGVLITKKNDLYGAMNYAGEELVPNVYGEYYLFPSEEGYFVLANYMDQIETADFILQPRVAYVFDSSGKTKLVVENMCQMVLCGDKVLFSTYETPTQYLYTHRVHLYDLSQEKILYTSEELEPYEWVGGNLFVSEEEEYYYILNDMCYQIQLKKDNSTTVVQVDALCGWSYITNISDGYAWANVYPTDTNALLSKNESERKDCSGITGRSVSYMDNGLWKINKGTLMVRQSWDEKEYYLINLDYAKYDEWGWLRNEEVIVATYDYIGMSDSPYYLAADGDKYFYIDESGQIVHDSYLDYSKFYGGYAMIIDTDGCAYMIDEQFNKVAGGYKATSIFDLGGIFCVENNGELHYLARPTE